MEKLMKLVTETSNAASSNLDQMPIAEILQVMNEEDHHVPRAVKKVLPILELVVEKVVASIESGGRLIYVGAGTSGRIGVLDAVECPPTFSTSPELVKGIMAGGDGAIRQAVEGVEDSLEQGREAMENERISQADVVIGIAASGRTPFVIGALDYANEQGATTVALVSNPHSEMSQHADHTLEVVTGPEVLTGSTRLKAASAHKMVLNMISTTSMIKLGKVFNNLMVDVNASNYKLVERSKSIVAEITGITRDDAEGILRETDFHVKEAIVMVLANVSAEEARRRLADAKGHVKQAIQ